MDVNIGTLDGQTGSQKCPETTRVANLAIHEGEREREREKEKVKLVTMTMFIT